MADDLLKLPLYIGSFHVAGDRGDGTHLFVSVKLVLPGTGVCNVPSEEGGCCGGPPPGNTDACCVDDAVAKASGKDGCGCSGTASPGRAPGTVACCA
jgi:hypothetical protein